MLRSAILRSSRASAAALQTSTVAATAASRRTLMMAAAAAAPTRVGMGGVIAMVPRVQCVRAVRMYSAGAGLNKDEVEGRILSLLTGFDKVNDNANIKPTAHFANDLGLDSLDTVEVVMAIEEEFSIEIPDKDADGIHSVDKAVEYILHQPDAS